MKNFYNNEELVKEKKEIQYNELYRYKSESDDDDEKDKKEKDEDKIQDYSYEYLNKKDLLINIKKGTDIVKINFKIKNNGYKKWLKDTKLKIVDKYKFNTTNIILNKQNPEEENTYEIIFYN